MNWGKVGLTTLLTLIDVVGLVLVWHFLGEKAVFGYVFFSIMFSLNRLRIEH